MVPWAHPSQPPNGISIGSSVFAAFTNVTNRQTDRPRYSVCHNRPHLRMNVMRHKTKVGLSLSATSSLEIPNSRWVTVIYYFTIPTGKLTISSTSKIMLPCYGPFPKIDRLFSACSHISRLSIRNFLSYPANKRQTDKQKDKHGSSLPLRHFVAHITNLFVDVNKTCVIRTTDKAVWSF